jgi:hypothetical protein
VRRTQGWRWVRDDPDGGAAVVVATVKRSAVSMLRGASASSEQHCSLYVVVQQQSEVQLRQFPLVELGMRMKMAARGCSSQYRLNLLLAALA